MIMGKVDRRFRKSIIFRLVLTLVFLFQLSFAILGNSLQREILNCENTQSSPINFITSGIDENLQLFDIRDEYCNSWGLHFMDGFWAFDEASGCTQTVSISFENRLYTLKKIYFKASSEHSLGSGAFDGEIQLFHEEKDSGKQLILVLWLDTFNVNQFGNEMLSSMLSATTQSEENRPKDFYGIYHQILPVGDLSYLTYSSREEGSCDEDTVWLVMLTPVSVPTDQFQELVSALSGEDGELDEAFLPRPQAPRKATTQVRQFRHEVYSARWEEEAEQCKLASGVFAISMQVVLCVVSITSLVIKRFLENPRRTWKIWFFDVSKQGFGAGFIHVWNMVLAVFISYLMSTDVENSGTDECALYAMNLSIDIFVGTCWVFVLLKVQTRLANHYNWTSLQMLGNYGHPPQTKIYLQQLGAYFVILLVMKTLNATLILSWRHHLDGFYTWIFTPLEAFPKFELIVVMVLMPACLNVIQYWIVDNFLKDDKLILH